ncbi:helix-turn-helix transcriptional regulator [Trueperella sp. LYQ141]|uniref:helix-turn-helix transcriptional regulator n=1 Tax=Trueperella sp. LYQ141 TaxID=3391058 RepID=UPI0039838F7A
MSMHSLEVSELDRPLYVSQLVAANVRAEAARRLLTQGDLARALGVTQGAISMKWTGRRAWKLDDLGPLSELFDIPLSQFFISDMNKDARTMSSVSSVHRLGLEPRTL